MILRLQIIDKDENSKNHIKASLSGLAVEIIGEHSGFDGAYEKIKKAEADIVIINFASSVDKGLEVCEKISKMLPMTAVFVISPETTSDLIIRSMRAGAREYFSHPVQKAELVQAVESIINAKKQRAQEEGDLGKVITVFGTKGGVGTTAITTNLAAAINKISKQDVVLLDLNLQLGNSALFLNAKPQYSLVDVAKNLDSIDTSIFKKTLPKSPDGIHILTGPQRVEDSEYFDAQHFKRIVDILRALFPYILIDTRSAFDELTIKAMDEADTLFVVSNLEFPTIYNTKNCLELFSRMEYTKEKVKILINRYTKDNDELLSDLEKIYTYSIADKIPNHPYESMISLVNYGSPVVLKQPRAKTSQKILEIAENVCNIKRKSGLGVDSVISKFMKKAK
jgi:pilus assembly protein CpaE